VSDPRAVGCYGRQRERSAWRRSDPSCVGPFGFAPRSSPGMALRPDTHRRVIARAGHCGWDLVVHLPAGLQRARFWWRRPRPGRHRAAYQKQRPFQRSRHGRSQPRRGAGRPPSLNPDPGDARSTSRSCLRALHPQARTAPLSRPRVRDRVRTNPTRRVVVRQRRYSLRNTVDWPHEARGVAERETRAHTRAGVRLTE
jgi:hypothetical protein